MKRLITVVSLLFAFGVHADESALQDTFEASFKDEPIDNKVQEDYIVLETPAELIRVSEDGLGIVKQVGGVLKITKNTKVFVNGEATDIVSAKSKVGNQLSALRFNPNTKEVESIRW